MPRLFTALALPPEIGQALSAYRGGLPGARWIEPADYHVTLRFLGDIDNAQAEDVHALLEEASVQGQGEWLGQASSRPALDLEVVGLASFGGDRPRAVYAGLAPDPGLAALQAEHERIARQAGLDPERRRFTPHVTLARLGRASSAEAVARYLAQAGLGPRLQFSATESVLYSARESRGGGPYRIEARYPFAAEAGDDQGQ